MKILVIHNYYQQSGGEDQVFVAESSMLEKHGCRVFRYMVHNDSIKRVNFLVLARYTLWNKAIANELRDVIRQARPDVIHFHNTFPLISPSAYYAARAEGIPVVQTLHNYRLLCPNALFFHDGHVCEDCMGKFMPWPGVLHACYRGSRAASTMIVAMLSVHRVLRTYSRMVDMYITLTNFARLKFIQGGFPAEKIAVKPNFVASDFDIGNGQGGYVLFVGRLTQEKGINTLLLAWEKIGCRIPLKIAGDGQLRSQMERLTHKLGLKDVEILGHLPTKEVVSLIKNSRFIVFPSECYENFPVTIAEAYACSVPVIASKLGAMEEIVEDGKTGLQFTPGDPTDLAEKVEWAWMHPKEIMDMRFEARKEYEEKYTAEHNYEMLMEIYKKAANIRKDGSKGTCSRYR